MIATTELRWLVRQTSVLPFVQKIEKALQQKWVGYIAVCNPEGMWTKRKNKEEWRDVPIISEEEK